MEELKKDLENRLTFYNLCDTEIVELSQRLEVKVVEQQKKMLKGVNWLGTILEIVDRVAPRVLARQANEGGILKEIIREELKKELEKEDGQTIAKKNTLHKPFER